MNSLTLYGPLHDLNSTLNHALQQKGDIKIISVTQSVVAEMVEEKTINYVLTTIIYQDR